jgi:hypothetical protein
MLEGFDVAVKHAAGVGVLEGFGDLGHQGDAGVGPAAFEGAAPRRAAVRAEFSRVAT